MLLPIDHAGMARVLTIENRRSPIRIAIAFIVSTFLFTYLGTVTGAVWLAVVVALEIVCALSRRRVIAGDRRWSGASLFLTFAIAMCWVTHAVLLWNTGQEVPHIAAVMDLFSVALYGAIGAYQSRAICLVLVLPPLTALAGLLITYLWGHAPPFMAAMASAATLGTCATVLLNCFIMHRQDLALTKSNAALENLNAELAVVAEAAQAANQAKSDFLSNMSHEIRTPLNGVLGMAQAMAADDLSPRQAERLGVVRESGRALLAIVNDVLDLSKIEAGKLQLETIGFDLAALLADLQRAYAVEAGQKRLALLLDVDPGAQGVYLGDPTRLRQVLSNFISNALKFTTVGEIRISAQATDRRIRLTVSDTGAGIEPARLGALFQRFTQADSATTRIFGGTGLGLAICDQLVRLMRGSIEVQSRPGQGSAFTVSLDLPRVADAPADRPDPAVSGAPAPGPQLRVLVAEDNGINQLVLRTFLEQFGLTATMVDNGAQAIEAWRQGAWDVVLMDIQMPGMDGSSAVKAIRDEEAASGRARTPIIALTANAMNHQIAQYRADGMDGHVSKPIDARLLYETLCSVIAAAGAAIGGGVGGAAGAASTPDHR